VSAHGSDAQQPRTDRLLAVRNSIAHGRCSVRDVVVGVIDRMTAGNASTNALTQILADESMARAAELDAMRVAMGAGETLPALFGVPMIIKDNICTRAGRTTCASRMLEQYRSPFDATCVRRLLDAGAVIVAKSNLDEFAMGGSGEHSVFGPTRNPWDLSRVPGGSSSGSAAAVAAGYAPAALGSDTGGSIRQPAALCGLTGIKPTYGRVSRLGLVAFASSLDQVGPMAHSAAELAPLLATIMGHDPGDSTSLDADPLVGSELLTTPIAGLRLGVPRQAYAPANHPSVTRALESTIATFRASGATIVDIDLPHADAGIAAYYIIAPAEASSNLARYDGVRFGRRASIAQGQPLEAMYTRSRTEGFGSEVQRRIMLGTHVLSSGYYDAYYLTALRARRLIKQDFDHAFSHDPGMPGVHAVLMPATPTPAFALGEKLSDPLSLYLEDVYTVGVNLAGLPGLSFPAGFDTAGPARLPIGMQLVGPALGEWTLLRIAHHFQTLTDHHEQSPGATHGEPSLGSRR